MRYIQIDIPLEDWLAVEHEEELSPDALEGFRKLLGSALTIEGEAQIAKPEQIIVRYIRSDAEDPLKIAIAALEELTAYEYGFVAEKALERILNP